MCAAIYLLFSINTNFDLRRRRNINIRLQRCSNLLGNDARYQENNSGREDFECHSQRRTCGLLPMVGIIFAVFFQQSYGLLFTRMEGYALLKRELRRQRAEPD